MSRQIYVAVLADYNAGSLHGAWIDVEGKSVDELQSEVDHLLRSSKHPNVLVNCITCDGDGFNIEADESKTSCKACNGTGKVPSAEEWAIHDSEGLGKISEHESLEKIVELDAAIEEHGDAYFAYIEHVGADYATVESFQDAYQGEWDNWKAYVENYIDECMEVPEHLANYIDVEKVGRDLSFDYNVENLPNGNVAVFRNC